MIFEDLEFQFINILVALASIIIIYFAWKSTNVREDRLPPTAVLIIENNRRRLLENVVRPQLSQVQQETIENLQIARPNYIQEVIDEVSDSVISSGQSNNYHNLESVDSFNDLFARNENESTDQQQIVNDMDNPDTAEGLRRRRLAFYAHEHNPSVESTNNNISTRNVQEVRTLRRDLNLQTGDSAAHADNCSNENNENENISKSEENRILGEPLRPTKATAPPLAEQEDELMKEEFRIKLKYLNDDLRLVKGSPNEEIGDFKKRNFTVELAAQKLVRLVFNGHVLQPDTKTLKSCGLFDNCVVHCLVHKKPNPVNIPNNSNNQGESQNQQSGGGNEGIRNIGGNSFLDGNTNGPFFIYFGIAMVSLAIIFCWYCRIQYSSIFSLYSTIGLVLMTALFLIIFPLVILIERDVST